MPTDGVNKGRRQFLVAATSVVGAVGVGFAAVPFIESWMPSAKAQAVGAPVKVNFGALEPNQVLKVLWRGQTVGILRRTKKSLDLLPEMDDRVSDPKSLDSEQPSFARNEYRSARPEYLVVIMICTHLGCVPRVVTEVGPEPWDPEWKGGFFCPCHKSKYDLAGRVYKGQPAPLNLRIPPYHFIDDETVLIGVNPEGVS